MKKTKKSNRSPSSVIPRQTNSHSSNQLNSQIVKKKETPQATSLEVKPLKNHSSHNSKSNIHSPYFPSSIEAIQKTSEYDKNYLNDSYEKESIDFRPEPMPIRVGSQSSCNLFQFENEMDKKLKYALKTLDLYQFKNNLMENSVTFNDILLLSKNDLIEMGIQLGPRNRILKFSEKYKEYAKDFDLDELKRFFNDNKNLVINSVYDDDTQDSSNKKRRDIDSLKASMDKLCNEMSEGNQIIMGFEDKLIQKQRNNNKRNLHNNNHRSLKFENIYMPDISEIKENEADKHHRLKSRDCILNRKIEQEFQREIGPIKVNVNMSRHQRYGSNPNLLKNKQIKTMKRNWTLPRPIAFLRNCTFKQLTNLKTSRGNISNRQVSPVLQYIPNTCTKSPIQQSTFNHANKKDKFKQTYRDLFIEIEAYQQEYQNMKIRSDQRNNQINSILLKTDPKFLAKNPSNPKQQIQAPKNICVQKPINEKNMPQTHRSTDSKHQRISSDSITLISTKLTDATSLEKINEILSKKKQLKETLNECRESINQKKMIIEKLEENNDDMQYLFNL